VSGAPLVMLSGIMFILGLVVAEVLKQIVAREYDSWAPALARVLVRLAGWLHAPRAREWEADVAYLQVEEGESGLWAAAGHLAAAPRLTGVSLVRWLRAVVTGRDADPADLAAALLAGGRWVSRDDAEWLRFRCEEAGQPYHQAENVYRLGNLLVSSPQVVTFVRADDGTMRGFTVEGADDEGVCVGASFYARHRSRLERAGRRIVVVEDDVLEPVADIAAMAANFFCEELPDRPCPLTLVFESGSPELRLFGAPQKWSSSTAIKGHEKLARRTLARRWPPSRPGLVLTIPPVPGP
jgi:hypothetical protein